MVSPRNKQTQRTAKRTIDEKEPDTVDVVAEDDTVADNDDFCVVVQGPKNCIDIDQTGEKDKPYLREVAITIAEKKNFLIQDLKKQATEDRHEDQSRTHRAYYHIENYNEKMTNYSTRRAALGSVS